MNNQGRNQRFSGNAGRSEVARRHDTTSPLAHPPQEQPVKSSSAAVVVAPAVTFSGMAVAFLLVGLDDDENIPTPVFGFVGSDSNVNSTYACTRGGHLP